MTLSESSLGGFGEFLNMSNSPIVCCFLYQPFYLLLRQYFKLILVCNSYLLCLSIESNFRKVKIANDGRFLFSGENIPEFIFYLSGPKVDDFGIVEQVP